MNQEMMRIIDSIARDKNIERDVLIGDIEQAMIGALKKNYDDTEDVQVKLDVLTGEIRAVVNGAPVDVRVLGRIAAQAAKQMIIQKTRDRERTSIFEDYSNRRGTIVTGTVIRAEGGNLLVNVGRTEGFLPRSEQIRMRCTRCTPVSFLKSVNASLPFMRIILSSSHVTANFSFSANLR